MELRAKASLNDVSTAIRADVFSRFLYRFSYAEDLDMGLRLLKAGLPVALLRSARIIHGHNRPAGYYLRRAYVEGESFSQIMPALSVPRRTQYVAARMVTHSGKILSRTLEGTLQACSDSCETAAFFVELRMQYQMAQKAGESDCIWLSRQDALLGEYLFLLKEYSGTACSAELEPIQNVLYYLETYVKPFMLAQGQGWLEKAGQLAVADCAVKQFCANAGMVLAGVRAGEPLYSALQALSKGV